MPDEELQGLAFCGDTFSPRNVSMYIEGGTITEITDIAGPARQWIIPSFFNAHTHIADTVGMDTPVADKTLTELVAPPDGLKHRILRATSDGRLIRAMQESMMFMFTTGTTGFAEFREGGPHGVDLLSRAVQPGVQRVVFGRDGGEFSAEGLGLSSAKNRESDIAAVNKARAAGKKIAIHAGEAGTKDIDDAFALEPDLIIHATYFEDRHIRLAADAGIPLVLCPRSNWILGGTSDSSRPPVRKMLDAGCTLWLGTDNVMFVPPDMFAECAFLSTVYKTTPEETLQMATGGSVLLGHRGVLAEGEPADFICLDPGYAAEWTQCPALSLFSRLGSRAVRFVHTATENQHIRGLFNLSVRE